MNISNQLNKELFLWYKITCNISLEIVISMSIDWKQGIKGRVYKKLVSFISIWKRMMNKIISFLMICMIIIENTEAGNTTNIQRVHTKLRSYHKMTDGWKLYSVIGVVGTSLNSIVLYLFISERKGFLTTVNVMIL